MVISGVKHHKQLHKKNVGQWVFYACLIALPLLQFVVLYVVVNFNSLTMAFKSYNMDTGWSWVGFENFKTLFQDFGSNPEIKFAFRNSLIAWAVTTVVTVPLALFFAYYIAQKFFMSKFFRIMLFLPSIISASILTIMFKYYADGFIPSVINNIFGTKMMGLISQKETIFPTLLAFNIFISFGVSVLMYTGTMKSIPSEIFESARLDGASSMGIFFKIVLPQMVGTISVFIISGIAGMFVTQLNLFSIFHVHAETETITVGYLIYRNIYLAGESYATYPYNAALGVFITIIVAPFIVLARKLVTKFDPMRA